MKPIPIKKGLFTLLIVEAVVIAVVSIAFMVNLYDTYTNLVYRESAEVLNLHSVITDAKLSEIENLSFEVLSNHDIQSNLTKYYDSSDSYSSYQAANDLYTQLFTRWIMNKSIVSISFVFLDGTRVDTGRLHAANLSGTALDHVINAAVQGNGSCGWVANMAGDNVITLYRLIRDISGNKNFRSLGTLIMNVDASRFFSPAPVISERYNPDIVCVAGDQILSRSPLTAASEEVLGALGSPNDYDIVRLGGELHFVSTKGLSYNDWSLVYMLSTRDLLSSIDSINIFYTISLVLIVALVVTIGYAFANAISRPLTQLTKAMRVVEVGDYSAALNDSSSELLAITEVAQLSRGFSKMVQEIDRLISEVYTRQLMIMEMRYKMLQQQINPHFLYNTLDTINWKAVQSNNQEIPVMVKALSKLLRGSIKGPDIITVGEDLSFVDNYIQIQETRFEERLEFRVDVPPSVHSCRIPRLTLQPIVENCIIHNLEKYSGKCEIRVSSSMLNERLEISVEDDGKGVDLHQIDMVLSGQVEATNKSIGLKNIDQRIKMAFGEDYGVSVENRIPTGTRVTVALPYTPSCEGESREDTADSR